MKKILSFILACVLCVAAITVSAFADTVSADDLFGVIHDADGNVVEYLPMPKTDVYVNNIHVIPAGGRIITYQYTTTQTFLFGFATTNENKTEYITEPSRDFEISLEGSNTLGSGNRVTLYNQVYYYSTGKDPKYFGPGFGIAYEPFLLDTTYLYCNGKLVNTSSSSATVRLIVARNYDDNVMEELWGY